MSYDTDDQSIEGSRPVELWKITTSTTTYRYTTSEDDFVFSGDGQTYSAIEGARDSISGSSLGDPPELVFTMRASLAVVQENAFGVPPQDMDVTVYRVQTGGAFVTAWEGEVTGFSLDGDDVAKMRSPSLVGDPFDTSIPTAYIQPLCNHVLYDARCTINKNAAGNKVVTTVATVSGRQVTVASVGGHVDQWGRAGYIETASEKRLILTQVGTSLKIQYPFRSLAGGASVTLYAGCSHQLDDQHGCKQKFSNSVNFGGHPHMQPANPFRGDVRGFPWPGKIGS